MQTRLTQRSASEHRDQHTTAVATVPIQRRVFTEQPEAVVRSPQHLQPLDDLIADVAPARFRDWNEIIDWLLGVDYLGVLDDEWVRVDQFTVLGESHDDSALALVKAIGTDRFRYEAGGVWPEEVGRGATRWAEGQTDSYLASQTGPANVSAPGNRNQRAEAIEPKLARVVFDIGAVARAQTDGMPFKNVDVCPGAQRPDPDQYSVPNALHRSFLAALVFVQSYQSSGDAAIESFYERNQSLIDVAAFRLLESDRNNVWPDYSSLLPPKLLTQLGKVLWKEAVRTSAPPKTAMEDFKSGLGSINEKDRAAATSEAKEADYLRDYSMFESILEARQSGDLVFIIGDEHRQKLDPYLNKEGIAHAPWRQFVADVANANNDLADRLEPDNA